MTEPWTNAEEDVPEPNRISESALLVVEGPVDKTFFGAFIKHVGVTGVQIDSLGGKDKLGQFLRLLQRRPGYADVTSIAIVRDADRSAESEFGRVTSLLNDFGFPAPEATARWASGESATPAVGVFILPGDDRPGELETLLCQTLEGEDIEQCINAFFECAGIADVSDKARARAFVSTMDDPEATVGRAAQTGDWNLNHAVFGPLGVFLGGLS